MKMQLKISRFNPVVDEKPYFQDFVVDAEPGEKILDCLNRIKWEQDGSLSFRLSCAHGVCGSCAMKINGKCALACQKLVKDYGNEEVVIEPLPSFTVLKDLIVDVDKFLSRVEFIRPFLISHQAPPDKERPQSVEDRKKIDEVIRCILCSCCTASCPVTLENDDYLGPATFVQAFRRIFDSRDDEVDERLRQMDDPNAVWACVNHFECTRACPKEIPVTKSINFIKREIEKAFGKK